MLKGRGDDMGLALPLPQDGRAADGLVIGLGAAGGEVDLAGRCAEQGRDAGAGVLQRLLRLLADGVQTGWVAVYGFQIGQHGVNGRSAHLRRCRVVSIDSHGVPPVSAY